MQPVNPMSPPNPADPAGPGLYKKNQGFSKILKSKKKVFSWDFYENHDSINTVAM